MCRYMRLPIAFRDNQQISLADSTGTIVLKEIIVVFIVLRDRVWGFGMVHRSVGKMTIVYEVSEFGQVFVLFRVV